RCATQIRLRQPINPKPGLMGIPDAPPPKFIKLRRHTLSQRGAKRMHPQAVSASLARECMDPSWESFARRRTPLPQDDNGERKGVGQVRDPAPTWLGKASHCFAKARFLTANADSE